MVFHATFCLQSASECIHFGEGDDNEAYHITEVGMYYPYRFSHISRIVGGKAENISSSRNKHKLISQFKNNFKGGTMKSLALVLVSMLLFASANSATKTWSAAGLSKPWSGSNNWSGNTLPVDGDDVVIDGSGSAICEIDISTPNLKSFTMSSGTVQFTVSGNLNVGGNTIGTPGGNFSLTGGVFTSTNGTVTFRGVNATYGNGTANTFNNIVLNKTAGNSLTMNNNMIVNGTLTLTSGILVTGANKVTVTNTAPGAVDIPSISGSINGQIERVTLLNSTGTYKFTNTNTHIIPAALQASRTISVTSFPGVYPPAAPAGTAINRYYTIAVTGGAFTASELRLEYLESELNGIPEPNLVFFRKDVQWVNEGGAPITTSNYVVDGPISAFSDWTMGDGLNPLPIQLASFTGNRVSTNSVRLNWRTISEVNNYGFYVQKRIGSAEFTEIANSFINGHGTTNEPQNYSFTDNSASVENLDYRLKQVDLDGTIHYTEPIVVSSPTGVNESAPVAFRLEQNYPNPFNPSTEIRFSVEKTGSANLDVFNSLGQKVATLFDEVAEAGKFYRVKFDGANLSSGVYFYRLSSGNKSELKKLVLMK
jgi:hypothetical protein